MSNPRLAIVILAAGKGTRMHSELPKVMHKLAEKPMLQHVLDTCAGLRPTEVVIVAGPDMPAVHAAAKPHAVAVQHEQRGTGHAVMASRDLLAGAVYDDVLVIYGDTPLIGERTFQAMIDERRRTNAAVVVLGMRLDPPNAYGRLIVDGQGNLAEIVEAAEASIEQLALTLCNSGVMAIDGAAIFDLLSRVTDNNVKGEFYLTDIVALARADGRVARVVEAPAEELAGVNSRADQAAAETVLQHRLRNRAMAGGATLIDPQTVFFCADTVVGQDVVIGPNVVFGPGVSIANGVEIRAFSHIEGATIGAGAIIGPFARLRPGTVIGEAAHVGNFVEIKNAVLGAGAKANHLSYLGDADIGARTNIGAGTITCNYDGFMKYRTNIGSEVFIGTHTSLVAPVTVGDGAITAAGSVITSDVPADALAIGRARQVDLPGRARQFRDTKQQAKADKAKG